MEASETVPPADPSAQPGIATNPVPDAEHAPAATTAQDVIVGQSGLGEQQPQEGLGSNQNTPLVGATQPAAQSGVPLPEDRAAGVEANTEMKGMVAPPVGQVGGEVPAEPVADTAETVESPPAEQPPAPPAQ
jgi:hypothetical protein